MKKLAYLFATVAYVLAGCAETPGTESVDPGPDKPFMDLSEAIEFDFRANTGTLDVATNVDNVTCRSFDGWCEVDYEEGVLTVSVESNGTYVTRKTSVELRGGGLLRQVLVSQSGIKVFNPADIFTDGTCSELKPGIGLSDMEKITNEFYKTLATRLLSGEYDTEFRVQTYKAWPNPDLFIASNKTYPPGLRNNPTGIAVSENEELVVFAGDTHGQKISLFVQDPRKLFLEGTSYPLLPGVNRFTVPHSGLVYVMYHTPTGTEPDVKIHIASGMVNGYFDSQKHRRERWGELLNNAPFEHFDLVGKRAHLTFETAAYREYTPDGMELINRYDEMVRLQQEFSGMIKYDRVPGNRTYFVVHNDRSYHFYATYYHTGYRADMQNRILDPYDYLDSSHEAGHMHQVRPGLCWHGTGEVTVHLYTMIVTAAWGLPGLFTGSYANSYDLAFSDILDAGKSYLEHSRHYCRFVPFWQLKLYMHDVLGKDDFYKDVHEAARKISDTPAPSAGTCQVEFVKICCDAAKLDLTQFFEAWGVLKAMNITVNDNGNASVVVTQKMVDDAKAYIAAKGYPKPSRDFTRITDANWADYKPQ
jgi:hypothetical protein